MYKNHIGITTNVHNTSKVPILETHLAMQSGLGYEGLPKGIIHGCSLCALSGKGDFSDQ
jgi:hypothetical protein